MSASLLQGALQLRQPALAAQGRECVNFPFFHEISVPESSALFFPSGMSQTAGGSCWVLLVPWAWKFSLPCSFLGWSHCLLDTCLSVFLSSGWSTSSITFWGKVHARSNVLSVCISEMLIDRLDRCRVSSVLTIFFTQYFEGCVPLFLLCSF